MAVGTIARLYSFSIDISAAAALLWDVGVIGTATFCLTLLTAAVESWRLSKANELSASLRLQLEAAAIALILILSSVIYVRDTVDGSTIQFLTYFLMGMVVFARRQRLSSQAQAGRAATVQPPPSR